MTSRNVSLLTSIRNIFRKALGLAINIKNCNGFSILVKNKNEDVL